ncbi:MAG: DUF222 domain-containing protein [Acidimicrobiia bacterium]
MSGCTFLSNTSSIGVDMEDIRVSIDQFESGPGPALPPGLFGRAAPGYESVERMRAHQRMVSHYQARLFEDMASILHLMEEDDPDLEGAFDGAAVEISAALHLTRRAAESDLAFAIDLTDRLPRLLEALRNGELDWRRVWVILQGTGHLELETARAVVDQIIERASHITTGQLRALLAKMCVKANPEDAARRYRRSLTDRRVLMEPTTDGTANLLGLELPPDRAAEAMRHLNDLAQAIKTSDEKRSIDQLRADVFLDLLNGKQTRAGSARGSIDLRVDLSTLAGLSEGPGELAGFGPVIADVARQVAERQHDAEWRWSVTDPDSGQVVCNGITRRRPTKVQRRHVESHHPTCIFPNCRMPASQCDLDHRIPWAAGGPTTTDHLGPLCRYHHVIRHRWGWKYRRLPDGDHLWTSRLGHLYTTSGRPP